MLKNTTVKDIFKDIITKEISDEELAARVLLTWGVLQSQKNYNPVKNKTIAEQFFTKILRKKLLVMDVDIIIPDELCLLIELCATTPLDCQLILVDILDNILDREGNIPKGYVITYKDFGYTFPNKFPLIALNKDIENEYSLKAKNHKFNGVYDLDSYSFWDKYRDKK